MRIATSELKRFMTRITHRMTNVVEKEDKNAWSNQLIEFYAEVMGRNLAIGKEILDMVLESKCPPIVAENKTDVEPLPSETPHDATENAISSPPEQSNERSTSSPELSGESSSESSSEEESTSPSESPVSSSSSDVLTDNWVSLDNQDGTVVSASEITEQSLTRRGSSETETPEVSDVESSEGSDTESPEENDTEIPTEKETPTEKEIPTEDNDDSEDTTTVRMTPKVDVRTLYPSNSENDEILPVEVFARLDERYSSPDSPDWMRLLPALKLRCVAAHYLQQILLSLPEEELIGFVSHDTISDLLKVLNASRDFAEDAAKNEDLAHAFQEAIFREWGIDDEMSEEALENVARLNHTQGSAMFFLTQTAGATNGVNRLLTSLYDHEETYAGEDQWDRRVFAGQCQVAIMEDIFSKFAESEAKEGHKVDPNVWRNSSESGSKVAMYCTSFASVVVGLLNAMLTFDPALIERNKGLFYPLVCELVGVRSEEIRKLVRRVLTEKFGPILGLGQDTTGKKPRSPKKAIVN